MYLLIGNHLNVVCVIHTVNAAVVLIYGSFAAVAWRAVLGAISSKNRCNLIRSVFSFARAAHTTRL